MAGSKGRKKGRLGENILTQPRRHVARGHSIHTWFTEPVNYRWPSGVEWLTVMLAPPWIASSMQITRAPSSCRHEFSTIPWRGERLFSTVAAPAIGGCRHRWWIDAREDCKSNLSLSLWRLRREMTFDHVEILYSSGMYQFRKLDSLERWWFKYSFL